MGITADIQNQLENLQQNHHNQDSTGEYDQKKLRFSIIQKFGGLHQAKNEDSHIRSSQYQDNEQQN